MKKAIEALNNKPLLHIGMTKTASSFIQQRVLSNVSNSIYLHDEANLLINAISQDLKKPKDKLFSKLKSASRPKILISHERLHGQHPGKLRNMVYRLVGSFNTLLVVRSPSSWIESFYRQRLKRGEAMPRGDWYNAMAKSLSRQLDIDRLYTQFNLEKEQTKLHILPYEMLVQDPNRFHKEFSRVAGISYDFSSINAERVNTSLPLDFLESIRVFNVLSRQIIEDDEANKIEIDDLRNSFFELAETKVEYKEFVRNNINANLLNKQLDYPSEIFKNMRCLESFDWYKDYEVFYNPTSQLNQKASEKKR